jgi:hypothetical protein
MQNEQQKIFSSQLGMTVYMQILMAMLVEQQT